MTAAAAVGGGGGVDVETAEIVDFEHDGGDGVADGEFAVGYGFVVQHLCYHCVRWCGVRDLSEWMMNYE